MNVKILKINWQVIKTEAYLNHKLIAKTELSTKLKGLNVVVSAKWRSADKAEVAHNKTDVSSMAKSDKIPYKQRLDCYLQPERN